MKTNQISIYFHWPFCESKCPYCDFNSHVRYKINHKDWLIAYLNNIDFWKEKLDHTIIRSIYFGGGTPSLMEPKSLSIILEKIYKNFSLSKDVEISLEANPSSVEKKKFKDFSLTGINRISIGIQSFNDRDLKYLGRKHTANDAITSVEIANSEFFNVNLDLIYGRQFQTLTDWEKELTFALSLGTQHLSLYQLTIEKGTVFRNLFNVGKLKGLPNQEVSKKFFMITNKLCKKNNYNPYEISNFAKKNFECFHNLNYWKCGNFISIGPGAHGRYAYDNSRFSYNNIKNPENWLESSLKNKNPIKKIKKLSKVEQLEELIIMGLRTNEGINLNYIKEGLRMNLNTEKIKYLKDFKFISVTNSNLKLLLKGKLVLNRIVQELLI
ncbi:MAG: radical SAM family heme chaperone HemW [Paracoccaceae bacterium]